jgi:HPt (histidine-containing phosphotransfer) domain-containing protein
MVWSPLRDKGSRTMVAPDQRVTGRVEPSVSILSKISGLDVMGALDRLGGDIDLYLDILGAFADKQAGSTALIEKGLNEGDMVLAERMIHNLKGNADTIGAVILRDVALLLEKTIRHYGPPDKVHRILEQLTHELEVFTRSLLRELPPARAARYPSTEAHSPGLL